MGLEGELKSSRHDTSFSHDVDSIGEGVAGGSGDVCLTHSLSPPPPSSVFRGDAVGGVASWLAEKKTGLLRGAGGIHRPPENLPAGAVGQVGGCFENRFTCVVLKVCDADVSLQDGRHGDAPERRPAGALQPLHPGNRRELRDAALTPPSSHLPPSTSLTFQREKMADTRHRHGAARRPCRNFTQGHFSWV